MKWISSISTIYLFNSTTPKELQRDSIAYIINIIAYYFPETLNTRYQRLDISHTSFLITYNILNSSILFLHRNFDYNHTSVTDFKDTRSWIYWAIISQKSDVYHVGISRVSESGRLSRYLTIAFRTASDAIVRDQ